MVDDANLARKEAQRIRNETIIEADRICAATCKKAKEQCGQAWVCAWATYDAWVRAAEQQQRVEAG